VASARLRRCTRGLGRPWREQEKERFAVRKERKEIGAEKIRVLLVVVENRN